MIMPASPSSTPKPKRRLNANEGAQSVELSPTVLYSAEAEKAVLGCMMAQPAEVIDEVTETLSKEDFFVPAHQEIFAALREMHNMQQAIDVMTIHQWLTDRKLAEPLGSPGIQNAIMDSEKQKKNWINAAPSVANRASGRFTSHGRP